MTDDSKKSTDLAVDARTETARIVESLSEQNLPKEASARSPAASDSVLNIHDQLTNEVMQKLNLKDSWILIAGGCGGGGCGCGAGCGKGL